MRKKIALVLPNVPVKFPREWHIIREVMSKSKKNWRNLCIFLTKTAKNGPKPPKTSQNVPKLTKNFQKVVTFFLFNFFVQFFLHVIDLTVYLWFLFRIIYLPMVMTKICGLEVRARISKKIFFWPKNDNFDEFRRKVEKKLGGKKFFFFFFARCVFYMSLC